MSRFKKSLYEDRPEVAALLHPTKNGELNPKNIASTSKLDVWWMCDKGHEYVSKVWNKQTIACNVCIGKTLHNANRLATVKPEIAEQWHPTKNGELTPEQITANSNKKVWWLCPRGHEYNVTPAKRKNPYTGCKHCSSERHTSFGEQSVMFYLQKVFKEVENRYPLEIENRKTVEIDIYIPKLNLGIEYDGFYHKNPTRDEVKAERTKSYLIELIRIRESNLPEVNNLGMPVFSMITENLKNELNVIIPELIDYLKNNYVHYLDNVEILALENIDVDLIRDENFVYQNYLTYEKNNSLKSKFPDIAKEWNFEKNGILKPEFFSSGTRKKVWWKCKLGHEWFANINNRTSGGNGCIYCSGQAVTKETCLSTTHPELMKLWNFDINKTISPNEVSYGTKKKVFWNCP